jgi:tRNA pseudouridine55 synthase
MASLVRSRQGEFELGKNVFEYADLEKGEDHWVPQIQQMLENWTPKPAGDRPVQRQGGNRQADAPKPQPRREPAPSDRRQRRNSSSGEE